MKIIIALLLIGAVVSLFSGLFFLVKDPSDKNRTVKALTWRVIFCVALVAAIGLMLLTGQLQLNPTPHP